MSANGSDDRMEFRIAGSGGQGVILAGIILAEAAAIYGDRNAVQSQSYGPESRGGASRSEVVISSGDIDYPKVEKPHLLVALTQEAADAYGSDVRPDGLVLVDAPRVACNRTPAKVVEVPITDIAVKEVGRAMAANIVALGALAAITGAVSPDALERAVAARVPRGTVEMNLRALRAGIASGLASMH